MLRHRGTCDETPSSDERRHQTARENGSTYVHQSGAHPRGIARGCRLSGQAWPQGSEKWIMLFVSCACSNPQKR
jgi:hypothetical protein